jgi:hypothetical protein
LPEIDESTRTAAVVFQFDPGQRLLVGQLARLALQQRVDTKGIWLPTSALVKGIRGLWSCFAVEKTHDRGAYEVRRRDVEVLHTEADRVFVRGTINDGDRIIKDGVQRVVPGQLVKVKAEGG